MFHRLVVARHLHGVRPLRRRRSPRFPNADRTGQTAPPAPDDLLARRSVADPLGAAVGSGTTSTVDGMSERLELRLDCASLV